MACGDEESLDIVMALIGEARHKKTGFKVFVVVIPKEGLAGWGPANPSLGMTPTTEYNL